MKTFLIGLSQTYLSKIRLKQKEELYYLLKAEEEREGQYNFEIEMRSVINNLERNTE